VKGDVKNAKYEIHGIGCCPPESPEKGEGREEQQRAIPEGVDLPL